jgi:hypothetical protein
MEEAVLYNEVYALFDRMRRKTSYVCVSVGRSDLAL